MGFSLIAIMIWLIVWHTDQYVRNQLQEDYADDQMSIKEYFVPFTGEPVKEDK